ncbi:GNAT family N-acetyltransferase [Cytobacillus suaedae]|nr:GNAT family N-acetyltransferase [Cytobacillus suaedae]
MKTLLEDFAVRSPIMEDASAVTDFVSIVDIDEFGFPDIEIQDVIDLWNELPINKNVWIIELKDSKHIVGYGFIEESGEDSLYSSAFVHPQFKGKGIGTSLLELIDIRAKEIRSIKEKSLKLDNVIPATNTNAINLLESRDYQFNRLYQRMRIDMDTMPESVSLPQDITIRPYQHELDAVRLHATHQETFKDTRDFSPQPYDEWIKQKSTANYDQTLWFVAYAGDELVGFIICKLFDGEHIYVDRLGVKRPWRKHGIGLSLINTVFRESYQRGNKTVLISVDSNSLTKANLLYEQAGFKTVFKVAAFQKMI